jgi:hypothetical protein
LLVQKKVEGISLNETIVESLKSSNAVQSAEIATDEAEEIE